MGVGAGLYMCDVVKKSSRSLSHLLMSSCSSLATGVWWMKIIKMSLRRRKDFASHGSFTHRHSSTYFHQNWTELRNNVTLRVGNRFQYLNRIKCVWTESDLEYARSVVFTVRKNVTTNIHRESKKGATLAMAITLSILSLLQRVVNFQQNPHRVTHHNLSMLLYYLRILKNQKYALCMHVKHVSSATFYHLSNRYLPNVTKISAKINTMQNINILRFVRLLSLTNWRNAELWYGPMSDRTSLTLQWPVLKVYPGICPCKWWTFEHLLWTNSCQQFAFFMCF